MKKYIKPTIECLDAEYSQMLASSDPSVRGEGFEVEDGLARNSSQFDDDDDEYHDEIFGNAFY